MLLVSRIMTLKAGVQTGVGLAMEFHSVVNELLDVEVGLYVGGAGYPGGTYIFSAVAENMAHAQREDAKLLAGGMTLIPTMKQRLEQPSHLIDLMPTFVEAAGATYPEEFGGHEIQPMEGQSLLPVFDAEIPRSRTLYWEHEGNRAVRDGDWKLVGQRNGPWELYHIAQDRTELNNLVKSDPERVQQLKAKWDAWSDRVGVLTPQ